jgi:hypothetical protein
MNPNNPDHQRTWDAARRRDVFLLTKLLELRAPEKCCLCTQAKNCPYRVASGPVCADCEAVNNV